MPAPENVPPYIFYLSFPILTHAHSQVYEFYVTFETIYSKHC